MVKALERAIAEIGALPASDQERIGEGLLEYVDKLRALRADLDQGIRSLDAGEGRTLDIEKFIAQMHQGYGKA